MQPKDFHWEPFYVLGTITRFREVSNLNLCNRGKRCDCLLQT